MLPTALVLTLMRSEAVLFLLAVAEQLYGGVCLIALWGMDISNHAISSGWVCLTVVLGWM